MALRKRTITLSDEEWEALRRLADDSGTTRDWHDVPAFIRWLDDNLSPCPDGMTLDRIDNDPRRRGAPMALRKRTITLSDEEWEALRRLADDSGTTRHAFFRRLAQAAMRKFPPAGGLKTQESEK